MSDKLQVNNDEESFIILGSSPGTSMDIKFQGGSSDQKSIDRSQIEDALKDLSVEAGAALKAQFSLNDSPSESSMMIASTIVTDDISTENLQKKFGEILDENLVLKETLRQNNDSLKEQFLLIASCQEDMINTHKIHREKFDETKEMIEKLRADNKKLKLDLSRLTDSCHGPQSSINGETGETGETNKKAVSTSVYEFVTSPDEDTINKLTSQLSLVEKQRRQVIAENEKLTWQKESLEHIIDATSKERDDLKEKLIKLQTEFSNEKIESRDAMISKLEAKVSGLQADLKSSQLKLLDSENVKLEYSKYKSEMFELLQQYRQQIKDLHERLKEAETTVFQPLRFSLSTEEENGTEFSSRIANVKLYEKTIKHLAELFNSITNGTSQCLLQSMEIMRGLHENKMELLSMSELKELIGNLKTRLETNHSASLSNIGQTRSTLSILEGIFQDYKDLLKKEPADTSSLEMLAAALVSRNSELQAARDELTLARIDTDRVNVLNAQLDVYRTDFEAERDARAKMASERDTVQAELRVANLKIQELTEQLEEVRKLNPNIYKSATMKKKRTQESGQMQQPEGNMIYSCPKCRRYSSQDYNQMENHFDFCLDDF